MFNPQYTKSAYKIIKPYVSQTIHSASTLADGESKCYKEIMDTVPTTSHFSIINIATNEILEYQLNNHSPNQLSHTPLINIRHTQPLHDSLIAALNDKSNKLNKLNNLQYGGLLPSIDIKRIEERLDSLEKRIKNIEDRDISRDINISRDISRDINKDVSKINNKNTVIDLEFAKKFL